MSSSGYTVGPLLNAHRHLVAGYVLRKFDDQAGVQGWARTCPIMMYPHASVEVRGLISFARN